MADIQKEERVTKANCHITIQPLDTKLNYTIDSKRGKTSWKLWHMKWYINIKLKFKKIRTQITMLIFMLGEKSLLGMG
jgi:hypothetical protein